jgi:hypothetical protein
MKVFLDHVPQNKKLIIVASLLMVQQRETLTFWELDRVVTLPASLINGQKHATT